MTTTAKSVSIETLIKQLRKALRRGRPTPHQRAGMTLAQRALKDWGVFEIYEEKVLRYMVAESIAARLSLSTTFAKDRMDQLHRMVKYDEERIDPAVEG